MDISQAMIVKNEEKNIKKALSWGKGIVSEQIVVDTGSTDRTVEIAKSMGAKVYHFLWQDDFSLAKNFAISKCKYPWITMLDADEYFLEEDARKLKYYIELVDKDLDIHGLATALVDLKNEDGEVRSINRTIRIFRNRKDILYRRAIHEQLELLNGKDFTAADCTKELSVYHTGYINLCDSQKTKSNRNLNIIKKQLMKNPHDFEMRIYLANEYAARQIWIKALEEIRLFYKDIPEKYNTRIDIISGGICTHLIALSELEKAGEDKETILREMEEVVKKGKKIIPNNADFSYLYGRALYSQYHKYNKAISAFLEALDIANSDREATASGIFSLDIFSCYKMLADSYFQIGDMEGAVHYSTVVLQYHPNNLDILLVLLFAFHKKEVEWEDVKKFLNKIYREEITSIEELARRVGYSIP